MRRPEREARGLPPPGRPPGRPCVWTATRARPRRPGAELAAGVETLRRYPDARRSRRIWPRGSAWRPSGCWSPPAPMTPSTASAARYLDAARELVVTKPTFEMIPRYARLAGAEVRTVPWPGGAVPAWPRWRGRQRHRRDRGRQPEQPDRRRGHGRRPAAPGGRRPGQALLLVAGLRRIRRRGPDAADVLTLPNALVLRTLSKAWGLAGLRVGSPLGPPDLVAHCGPPAAVCGVGPRPWPGRRWPSAAPPGGRGRGGPRRNERAGRSCSGWAHGRCPRRATSSVPAGRGGVRRRGARRAGHRRARLARVPAAGGCLRITCPGEADEQDSTDPRLATPPWPRRPCCWTWTA